MEQVRHAFSERVLRDMYDAAILAGLEGILYEKQQNIFGVWIVHWVFGVSGTLLCLIDH